MKLLNEAAIFSPPIKGFNNTRVSSKWGENRGTYKHDGVDFAVPSGTPVYAIADGVVVKVRPDEPRCGGIVKINHGDGFEAIFCHLKSFSVSNNQTVKSGTLLGYSGGGANDPNKGSSRGAHLHFAMKKNGTTVNPLSHINKTSVEFNQADIKNATQGTNTAPSKSGGISVDSTGLSSDGSISVNSTGLSSDGSISVDGTRLSSDGSISVKNTRLSTDGKIQYNENLNNEINRIKMLLT
jgi:hypothetical protein